MSAVRRKRVSRNLERSEAESAVAFGVDVRTIRRWLAAGLPSRREGRVRLIDLATAIQWVRERDKDAFETKLEAATSTPDLDRERCRKWAADADLAEMQRDQRREDLVLAADVEERWSGMLIALREAVMRVPGVAVQAGLIPATREADLEDACRDALAAFAAEKADAAA